MERNLDFDTVIDRRKTKCLKYEGEHHVFAGLKKELEEISVICTSPSKTFNLAGMMLSNIFIPNRTLRRKFRKELDAAGIRQLGIMGLVACEAAYSKGENGIRL